MATQPPPLQQPTTSSATATPSIHERKYPFIFAASILFLTLSVLFLIPSSDFSFFSTSPLLRISSSHQFRKRPPTFSPDSNDPIIDGRGVNEPPVESPEGTVMKEGMTVGKIEFDEEMMRLEWETCTGPSAVDYIPCLDNWKAIKALKSRKRMEHRERHCSQPRLRCLVPLPKGYKTPILWPKSRDMIWYDNVPHPKLVDYKKDQRWVVKSDDHFIFPGGGTQFKEGVTHYIDFIQKAIPVIKWGQNIRVILDVGCGVASFGGHLLDRDVLTMSLAPKDEHEAQIQFALERGIPATLSVIATQQLTFPDNAYDLIHCARCRVHWDGDGSA